MKVSFSQAYYKSNINVSIDDSYINTIPYEDGRSLTGYIKQIPQLSSVDFVDEVEFSFQSGGTEKEEIIILFNQATETPIKIKNLSLYGNSVNRNALGKFRLLLDDSATCDTINCFILGKISDFILTNGRNINIVGPEGIDAMYLGGNFESLNIKVPIIQKIQFFTRLKDAVIKKFKILSTNILDIEFTGNEKLKIHEFLLRSSKISGGIFSNITFEESYFIRSIIENTNFYNIDFPLKKENFIISKTNFIKTGFTGVSWAKYFGLQRKILDAFSDEEIKISVDEVEMKEIFRMFKYLHDEIGNKTEANKFFAKEMEYHMKTIEKNPEKKWERMVLKLQKFTNDFGNNWTRAVVIYFIVALLGFGLAEVGDMVCKFLTDNAFCIPEFKSVWLEFIRYINPLPKTDEVPGLWYLLVSITKILIVYQIVVALRRISQR